MPLKRLLKITARIAWCLFLAWAATIFVLSSCTGEDLQVMPDALMASDKLVHAICFGAGSVLLAMSLRLTRGWKGGRLFWTTVLGIAIFGAIDEIHQLYTPGRSGADAGDWLADVIGSLIATAIYCFIWNRHHGNDTPRSPAPDEGATG